VAGFRYSFAPSQAVFSIESARLIAGLARMVRDDVGLAEEPRARRARDGAGEKWPESGVPDNPGAWLMATAKQTAIDELDEGETPWSAKHEELGH